MVWALGSMKDNEHLKGVSRVRSLEIILEWGKASLSKEKFQELLVAKNEDYLSYVNQMNEDEILPDVPRVLSFWSVTNSLWHWDRQIKMRHPSSKRRVLNEFQI